MNSFRIRDAKTESGRLLMERLRSALRDLDEMEDLLRQTGRKDQAVRRMGSDVRRAKDILSRIRPLGVPPEDAEKERKRAALQREERRQEYKARRARRNAKGDS